MANNPRNAGTKRGDMMKVWQLHAADSVGRTGEDAPFSSSSLEYIFEYPLCSLGDITGGLLDDKTSGRRENISIL